MINDIRLTASGILNTSNTQFQNNINNEAYENTFEDLILEQNKEIETEKTQNNSFRPLGVPTRFIVEFSMLQESNNENQ